MSKGRIYKVPTALEEAARYASAAGVSLEVWQAMDEKTRNSLKEKIDALAKQAEKGARAVAREQHYASAAGMTLSAWRELSAADRTAKKREIDACEKEERENARLRAASAKLKNDARKPMCRKRFPEHPASSLPGATRYSTVVGLMKSPGDRKWNLFLREGPYWNYLVSYIQRRNIFHGRRDRVEEAVMNACEKIGKFMVSKRYKYPEEGKGYFRGFIKTVALRTALDLYHEISRQEQILVKESDADAEPEFDKIKDDMDKATARCRARNEKSGPVGGIEDEIKDGIVPSSEHDLDVYDVSAGLKRKIAPVEKMRAERMHCISRLDDNPFSDDEMPGTYNPADLFDFMTKVSKEDLGWIQKLQLNVLYIALGYVLTNVEVSPDRREMLRLRYGLDKKPKDIYALPRFASRSREAFDAQMSRATDELRKEAASWWKLVAPNKNDFADETVLKFWRDLSRPAARAKIAIALQDKAIKIAGRIK